MVLIGREEVELFACNVGFVGKVEGSGREDDDILLLAQGLKFTSVFLAQVPKTAATTE